MNRFITLNIVIIIHNLQTIQIGLRVVERETEGKKLRRRASLSTKAKRPIRAWPLLGGFTVFEISGQTTQKQYCPDKMRTVGNTATIM